MTSKAEAQQALHNLLMELPAEFYFDEPDYARCRESFSVIKKRNVMTVWSSLHTLIDYLEGGSREDDTEPI